MHAYTCTQNVKNQETKGARTSDGRQRVLQRKEDGCGRDSEQQGLPQALERPPPVGRVEELAAVGLREVEGAVPGVKDARLQRPAEHPCKWSNHTISGRITKPYHFARTYM